MSNFWAHRLGNNEPPARPQPVQTWQQPRYQPVYQQQPQAPQQYQQPQGPMEDPTEKRDFITAMNTWGLRGGEAAKTEHLQHCPGCGTTLVFSRSNGNGAVFGANGAVAPAPRCFECGWNGKYIIGAQSNWIG